MMACSGRQPSPSPTLRRRRGTNASIRGSGFPIVGGIAGKNSLLAGNWQGIFADLGVFAKIRVENSSEFSSFEINSLRGRAGNFFERAGNLFRVWDRSRETGIGSNRPGRREQARPWPERIVTRRLPIYTKANLFDIE